VVFEPCQNHSNLAAKHSRDNCCKYLKLFVFSKKKNPTEKSLAKNEWW
jgi:hypothetical protein